MKSTANPWDLPAGCTPYVIPAGHGLATITLGQAIRILAGEEQTNGAFTICSVVGPKAGPVPQHWHEHEHDTFFCTRGAVQIWTDEQSRVLYPGGFANVPPGVKHAYALHEHHSEMVGLISPGGFERFFAATGWGYEGSAYPAVDERPTSPEQFQKAGAEFDVHFVQNPVYVNAGAADDDTQLPGRTASYYLRPGCGERSILGALLCTSICSHQETGKRFGMSTIEGAQGAVARPISHGKEHNVLYVLNGIVELSLDGEAYHLQPGDLANIPAGTRYGYTLLGTDNRLLAFSEHDVLARYFRNCGSPWQFEIYPAEPQAIDAATVESACSALGIELD